MKAKKKVSRKAAAPKKPKRKPPPRAKPEPIDDGAPIEFSNPPYDVDIPPERLRRRRVRRVDFP